MEGIGLKLDPGRKGRGNQAEARPVGIPGGGGVTVMSPNKGKDWGESAGVYPNSPLTSSVILDKSMDPLETSFLPSVNGENNNNSTL